MTNRKGDWMQTYSGRKFWPIDPMSSEVYIEDIAHALSMMCRYNGHCKFFYSVAEHSILVSERVPKKDALWGLLHDASEAYIADIVRPAKRFIEGYRPIEENIMNAVCERFSLPYTMPDSVHIADNSILADEMDQVMGPKPDVWNVEYQKIGVSIKGMHPKEAEDAFLERYHSIIDSM